MTNSRRTQHYQQSAPLRLAPLPRPDSGRRPAPKQPETHDWIHEWNQPDDQLQ